MEKRSVYDSLQNPTRRNYLLGFIYLCSGTILTRLWYLQILKGENFSFAAMKNRIREMPTQAQRGIIYDREMKPLLKNQLFFDLILIPQYIQDREKTALIVAKLFHISKEYIESKLLEVSLDPKFVPILIKKNLSLHQVNILESNKFFLPGVDIQPSPRRDYSGTESAHLFGHLGEVTTKELDILNAQNFDYQYQIGSIIGKNGVEKKYEKYLRGEQGKEALLVDAYGRLQAATNQEYVKRLSRQSQKGSDLHLTLDAELQKTAMRAFRNKNGAVCALDPQTGEILAYLSNPNYKLSIYQNGLTQDEWEIIRDNPFKPLLDKVTGGAYPPGSTFKVITAIAALEENVVTADKHFHCPGYFTLGKGRWKCWRHQGHGHVNMVRAIEQSCDVYFFNLGNLLGIDRIAKWARLFGLGEKSGLDLNMELSGIVPSTEWKLSQKDSPWLSGDTINAAIGQGFNLCTPLQVLNLFAAIGNGGKLMKPFLLKEVQSSEGKILTSEKPFLIRDIPIKQDTLAVIKTGLHNVVMSPTGTAKKARVSGVTVSGKTGTAQNSALKVTKGVDTSDLSFRTLDHAWFACYSPSINPEIAVVVFSEYDGGGGGSHAAPIAQKILENFWKNKKPDKFKTHTIQNSELQKKQNFLNQDLEDNPQTVT